MAAVKADEDWWRGDAHLGCFPNSHSRPARSRASMQTPGSTAKSPAGLSMELRINDRSPGRWHPHGPAVQDYCRAASDHSETAYFGPDRLGGGSGLQDIPGDGDDHPRRRSGQVGQPKGRFIYTGKGSACMTP